MSSKAEGLGLPEEILLTGQVEALSSRSQSTDLLSQTVLFGRLLRGNGVKVTSGNLIDLFESLGYIDVSDKKDFYFAARANLVSSRGEAEVFDRVFEAFWRHSRLQEAQTGGDKDDEKEALDLSDELLNTLGQASLESWDNDANQMEEEETLGYSSHEVLAKRDLGRLTESEIDEAEKVIVRLAATMAITLSRRRRSTRRGHELDFRRTFRKNILYGSDPVHLVKRQRKIKKTRLILLCDVSGSMKLYSRFLLQFIYGLQRGIRDVEVAVFSTRLTVITRLLKTYGVEKSLKEVSETVDDWSGGTNIGRCIRDFNRDFGRILVGFKSVVIIISDGWDRGDPEILRRQIESLRQRAHRIIWLNPLLGSPSYQPLCQGMKTALPYLDYFLPAHNLESLSSLAQKIKRVWR